MKLWHGLILVGGLAVGAWAVQLSDTTGANVGNVVSVNATSQTGSTNVYFSSGTSGPEGGSGFLLQGTAVNVIKATAGVLRGYFPTTAGAANSSVSLFDGNTVNHSTTPIVGPLDATLTANVLSSINLTFSTGLVASTTFVTQGNALLTYK